MAVANDAPATKSDIAQLQDEIRRYYATKADLIKAVAVLGFIGILNSVLTLALRFWG